MFRAVYVLRSNCIALPYNSPAYISCFREDTLLSEGFTLPNVANHKVTPLLQISIEANLNIIHGKYLCTIAKWLDLFTFWKCWRRDSVQISWLICGNLLWEQSNLNILSLNHFNPTYSMTSDMTCIQIQKVTYPISCNRTLFALEESHKSLYLYCEE